MMDGVGQFNNATLQFGEADTGNNQTAPRKSPVARTQMTARIQNKTVTDYAVNSMYSYKDGAFANAVELTNRELIRNEIDGEIKGAWLLTEIDHWDNEKERILIVCDHTLIIVRFDFVAMGMKDYKRLALHVIDKVLIGDLMYPSKSLMPARNHGGVRIIWNKNQEVALAQKWNPFSSDIPYTTFAHHPLAYYDKERDTMTYNVDDFFDTMITNINEAYRTKRPGENLHVEQGPITIESYANLGAMVFNQSNLGFSRERGGVSF